MVLYIFPSELFIVFPDIFSKISSDSGDYIKTSQRKKSGDLFSCTGIRFLDFLRENGIKKCRNTITGLQIGPEYWHPGIVPVDV